MPSIVDALSAPKGAAHQEEVLAQMLSRFQASVRREHPDAADLQILLEPEAALIKVRPPTVKNFGGAMRNVTVEDSVKLIANLLNLRVEVLRASNTIIIRNQHSALNRKQP